jgi:hypothetical protein
MKLALKRVSSLFSTIVSRPSNQDVDSDLDTMSRDDHDKQEEVPTMQMHQIQILSNQKKAPLLVGKAYSQLQQDYLDANVRTFPTQLQMTHDFVQCIVQAACASSFCVFLTGMI